MDPIRLGLAFITFSLNTYFGCFSVCAASRAPVCFQCHVFSATKRLRLDHPEEPHWGQWFNQGLQTKSFWDMVMICNIYLRDPGSPSENGFMEPKYLAEEVIIHPNHHLTR